jgi:hypothetical protein
MITYNNCIKIGKHIGKNWQNESANMIFTDTANINTNPILNKIIGWSLNMALHRPMAHE